MVLDQISTRLIDRMSHVRVQLIGCLVVISRRAVIARLGPTVIAVVAADVILVATS